MDETKVELNNKLNSVINLAKTLFGDGEGVTRAALVTGGVLQERHLESGAHVVKFCLADVVSRKPFLVVIQKQPKKLYTGAVHAPAPESDVSFRETTRRHRFSQESTSLTYVSALLIEQLLQEEYNRYSDLSDLEGPIASLMTGD